jgi:hypothetical protein
MYFVRRLVISKQATPVVGGGGGYQQPAAVNAACIAYLSKFTLNCAGKDQESNIYNRTELGDVPVKLLHCNQIVAVYKIRCSKP